MKAIFRKFCSLILASSVVSCGGGSSGSNIILPSYISAGMKMFITFEKHTGDFINDSSLSGSTIIQKADDFCMKSIMRPDNAEYKALLVDGVNRDAVSLTDWVLMPNTTYYRWYNDVTIGTTTPNAIFNVYFQNLLNDPENCSVLGACDFYMDWVWTGIGDVQDFSVSMNNCQGWTNDGVRGTAASYQNSDHGAFSLPYNSRDCTSTLRIYCVEQPPE